MSSLTSKARNDVIDAFRGVAILSVVAYHYLVRFSPPQYATDLYGYGVPFPQLLELGRFGVHLFFVISGLVITMTLVQSANVAEFWVKRVARLYPAYLVGMTLTFYIVRSAHVGALQVGLADYLAGFTMIGDHLGFRLVDGVYWSLIVELKFYFYVGWSFLFLRERFWLGILAVAFIGTLVRHLNPLVVDGILITEHISFFLVGIGLWFGIYAHDWRRATAMLLSGLACYIINLSAIEVVSVPRWYVHMYLAAGIGALWCCLIIRERINVKYLAMFGRQSYSFYLLHQNIGVAIIVFLPTVGVMLPASRIGIAFATCLLMSATLYRYVEIPGQRALRSLYVAVTASRSSVRGKRLQNA